MMTFSSSLGARQLSGLLTAALFTVGAAGSAGCQAGADEATEDPPVGEAQEAFASYGDWHINCNSPTGVCASEPTTTPGTSNTCFLGGIAGNLSSNLFNPSAGSQDYYATVGLVGDPPQPDYVIITQPSETGNLLTSQGICVPGITHRTAEMSWDSDINSGAVVLGAVTGFPNRQCFLTGVSNATPYNVNNKFTSAGDSVRVWQDGHSWYLGGSGHAAGAARCVDVTFAGAPGELIAGSSDATWNMTTQIDHGTSPLGMQCMLQGVAGDFRANSFTDGVFVNYKTSTEVWSISVSAGKTGWVNCVQ
jgi:hypothetical protein